MGVVNFCKVILLMGLMGVMGVSLCASDAPPMPSLPDDSLEGDAEGDGGEETVTPDTEVAEQVSLDVVDWSLFLNHLDWQAWDARVVAWYENCRDAATMTPPLPYGMRMHHSLGVEEWNEPFQTLCPNLESVVLDDIQMWEIKVEEHVDSLGQRTFCTLIGKVIVHKLPVPTTFCLETWLRSVYPNNLVNQWMAQDEASMADCLQIHERCRLAITLTVVPQGALSTYNAIMAARAAEERTYLESTERDPSIFSFTAIDVLDKEVFFEFYNPMSVMLNLLTKEHLDDDWNLYGEVGKNSSLGYATFSFPRQAEQDPHFFRIVDAMTDSDGDGLSDGLELNYFKSNPERIDSFNSGISDWDKVHVYQLSPSVRDSDEDGLIDGEEIQVGTDPLKADTDDDGLTDAEEVNSLQLVEANAWYEPTNSILNQFISSRLEIDIDNSILITGVDYHKVRIYKNGEVTLFAEDDFHRYTVNILGHRLGLNNDESTDVFFDEMVLNEFLCYVITFKRLKLNNAEATANGVNFQVVLSPSHPNRVWLNYSSVMRDSNGRGLIANLRNSVVDSELRYPREDTKSITESCSIVGRWGIGTDPLVADHDSDGLLDGIEVNLTGSNPLVSDSDGDGLLDGEDVNIYGTSALEIDTDGDSLPDAWEVKYGLDACTASGENGTLGDPDNDLLLNRHELMQETNPMQYDSDLDGLSDAQETGWIVSAKATFTAPETLRTILFDLTSNTDTHHITINLPSFVYVGGVAYSKILVSLDGILVLFNENQNDVKNLTYSNKVLKTEDDNSHSVLIAAYWDDLYYFSGITQVYSTETDEHYVIHYENIGANKYSNDTTQLGSFKIVLPKSAHESISIYYSELSSAFDGNSATIGIRSPQIGGLFRDLTYTHEMTGMVESGDVVHFNLGSWTNPNQADTDDDGLNDRQELLTNTLPFESDSDADGLPDGWEVDALLNPHVSEGIHGADGDPDGDGLRNLDEFYAQTSPQMSDTDDDTLSDLYEYGGIGLLEDGEWLTIPNLEDVTARFPNSSYGNVVLEIDSIVFENTQFTQLSINKHGRIDLFKDSNTSPSGLTESVPEHFDKKASEANHLLLAPCAGNLLLVSGVSSIRYGTTSYLDEVYHVIEFRNLGSAPKPEDYAGHHLSVQVLIPSLLTPTKPIRVNYGEVVGDLRGKSLSIGFISPSQSTGRLFCFEEDDAIATNDSLGFFLGCGSSPLRSDSDLDGLFDIEEYALGTNPMQPDSDGDELADGWELCHGYDPNSHNDEDNIQGNGKNEDPDGDGLTNQEEVMFNTNPHATDSDGDGVLDAIEVSQCSNPADATDEGMPMTYCPITFSFGDWSSSHSEKYHLSIIPRVTEGMTPPSYEWINQDYGHVETKQALLKSGVTYDVTLKHASTNRGEADLDYELNATSAHGTGFVIGEVKDAPFGSFDETDWDTTDKAFTITIVEGGIYCDLNRDGVIDKIIDGVPTRTETKILHHWVNNDYDTGNCSDERGAADIPGERDTLINFSGANYKDNVVNGRADLLDFVPLWFDIENLVELCPPSEGYEYLLSTSNEVGIVFTTLTKEDTYAWQTSDVTTFDKRGGEHSSYKAVVYTIDDDGMELDETIINCLQSGIVMLEGRTPGTEEFKLTVTKEDEIVSEIKFRFKIAEVEEMYRKVDITSIPNSISKPREPNELTDSYFSNDAPYVFFLHGFNVTSTTARGWHAEMFKRLWQTGCEMKFVGITWFGEEGVFEAFHYHDNVRNALLSGKPLANLLGKYSSDKKIVMAHSLGNMVVSSALQFYNANCDTFIMLNAAIPSEAFGATISNAEEYADCSESERLFVPDAWHDYPCKSWSVNWYKLFTEDEKESALTWRDIFKDIPTKTEVYNFYSSEDEVFELNEAVPFILSGTEIDFDWPYVDGIFPYFHLLSSIQVEAARYAWHKQEVFKGVNNPIGTNGGGWSFHCRERGFKVYPTGVDAENATVEQLRTRPVFSTREAPFLSSASQYLKQDYFTLLALHMPALTPSMGRPDKDLLLGALKKNCIDMKSDEIHSWGRKHFLYEYRWLHSDIKNMAYFYTHSVFSHLAEILQGGSK